MLEFYDDRNIIWLLRFYVEYFRKHPNVSDYNNLRRETEVNRIEWRNG
jgi:hypothetical protein